MKILIVSSLWVVGCIEGVTFIQHLGQWNEQSECPSPYIIVIIDNVIVTIVLINAIHARGYRILEWQEQGLATFW